MRGPLRRRVQPRPDETVASLASRLAARNAKSLRGFCLDMQFPLHAVHDGRTPVARAVAELAGYDPDAFAASMLTRLGDVESRDWSYRGQHLRTENLNRSCRRVCPLCLADDVARGDLKPEELAYARCAWRIRHLRTCMVHGVALIEVDDEFDKYSSYDTVQVYRSLFQDLPNACKEVSRRGPSDFEGYLTRRLNTGSGGVGWLDRKPLWAAAYLVERVGIADLFGRSPNLNRLSPDDWWQVGRAGLDRLGSGPEGVVTILDVLHDTFEFPRTGRNAPGRIYGQLWRWIERVALGPEFDDVRDVMREHALSRLPIAAGTNVLGRSLEERRVHSLRSAAVETGRHQRRLRKVLESHGLLPERHVGVNPNRLTVDVGQVAPLLAGIVTPMRTGEVLAFLQIARVQPLVSGDVLTPIRVSGLKAGQHEFAREKVQALMADLHRGAEPIDDIGPDQVDLVDACRVASQGVARLITGVLAGRFAQVWRCQRGKGLRSVVLSRREVKELQCTRRLDLLARYQVVRRLQVHYVAVQCLIDGEILPTVTMPAPRGGKPAQYVTEADLAAFQGRYVTLTEVARTRRTSIRSVKKGLVARGIEPALRPEDYNTAFYLRADL